ncbi:MAG: FAS1-like dehydratase domain-containing protein [Micromonosporaceae bacterium]
MALDPEVIGRSVTAPEPYEVSRAKIREFADAIGDPNPAYRDPEAARKLGHSDVVAPPTFPFVFTFAAGLPLLDSLGVVLRQVVHGDQRFAYTRPVVPGDELRCTVTVEGLRTMAGNHLLTTRTDVTDAGGARVLSTWSTLVVRPSETTPGPRQVESLGGSTSP